MEAGPAFGLVDFRGRFRFGVVGFVAGHLDAILALALDILRVDILVHRHCAEHVGDKPNLHFSFFKSHRVFPLLLIIAQPHSGQT